MKSTGGFKLAEPWVEFMNIFLVKQIIPLFSRDEIHKEFVDKLASFVIRSVVLPSLEPGLLS
jgi:hypothetical protein